MEIKIINTKTVPTIAIKTKSKNTIVHSKYDPLNEAKLWTQTATRYLKTDELIIIIGLGAGYHIKEFASLHYDKKIIVIEFNSIFYEWFLDSPFYMSVFSLPNVRLKEFSSLSESEMTSLFSSISSRNLLIHKSGLDIFPDNKFTNIKLLLEEIYLHKNSIASQFDIMIENFKKNILLENKSVKEFKNQFSDKAMILVSAGPSLDKQLPLLKEIYDNHKNKFVIGAVGTSMKSLISNGIIPNFFSIIDANPGTFEQISGL
jgi:hypothetical protein